MKIKTKLQLVALLSIAAIILIGSVVYVLFDNAERAGKTVVLAEIIAKSVIEQRIVADEYLLYREQRPKEQWQNKEAAIVSLLSDAQQFAVTNASPILQKLADDHESATVLFQQIVQNYETPEKSEGAVAEELEKRLAGQLLIKTQSTVTDAFALADASRNEAVRNQQLSVLLSSVGISILAVLLMFILFLFQHSVVLPLMRLTEGTRTIAEGNLAYRVGIKTRDEIGELASSFNMMAEKIAAFLAKEVAAERAKVQFITVAAHQMRTPLTGIKWALQGLVHGDYGALSQKQTELLQRAAVASDAMAAMTNDLLQASDIEMGAFEYAFQPHDFRAFIERILGSSRLSFEQAHIAFSFSMPEKLPRVLFDAEKLQIAFINVLENAVNYTPQNGTVSLTVEQKGERIVTTIKDSGIGIPPQDMKNIFTKLFRASNAVSVKADGSGLGLFLTHSIIESHGGTVELTSTLGKGSIVTISLPLGGKATS